MTYGALRSTNTTKALGDVHTIQQKYPTLAIDADIGYLAGQIEYNLRVVGQMIPEGDIWIAATAIGYQLTLVTLDTHFNRIAGLTVDYW